MAREAAIGVQDLSAPGAAPLGLTSAEARRRLGEFGANAAIEPAPPRWRAFLAKFWSPVPWMLEAAFVLQLGLGEYVEATVIAALLLFNATLGYPPGGPRKRRVGGAQAATGADRLGAPRRRMGEAASVRAGAGRCDQAAARGAGARRRGHRIGIAAGRPVDAHRRVRPSRCQSRQPGVRQFAGAPRPGHRRSDRDRRQDLFRACRRARARGPVRQHRTGGDIRGDAKPRHRERDGRGPHHRAMPTPSDCRLPT